MQDSDETKEYTYIQYLDFSNHYGCALSQLLRYGRFDYTEGISMFTHDFIINYNKNSDLGCTLIVDVNQNTRNHYLKSYHYYLKNNY